MCLKKFNLYAHEEEHIKTACPDCHFKGQATTVGFDRLGLESQKLAKLRKMDDSSRVYLATAKGNIPLINTSFKNGKAIMFAKNSGKQFALNSPAEICTNGPAHDRLSCSSCHSSWAPQCLGCHTEYDKDGNGPDHLTGKRTQGAWIEAGGEFLAGPPTMGVVNQEGKEIIDLFIPGMILTIDKVHLVVLQVTACLNGSSLPPSHIQQQQKGVHVNRAITIRLPLVLAGVI